MPQKKSLILVMSLDVEEDGLFSGRYDINPQIRNTAALARLEPFLERGARPTLFCAYSAFVDRATRAVIARLSGKYAVEIGAHLHHWNTPPLLNANNGAASLNKVPAYNVPLNIMDAKLKTLFQAGRDFQGASLASFRMGRWDLHKSHWQLLQRNGVLCDASVRPLHDHASRLDGPNHFNAPRDPYWVPCSGGLILETPLTVTPVSQLLGKIMPPSLPGINLQAGLKKWGVLAILPVQHPLWLMKLTTYLHARRGGRFISLTWHSSEMMPGICPHLQDEKAVAGFLAKVEKYLDWLEASFSISYASMNDIYKTSSGSSFPCPRTGGDGDWTC